MDFEALKEKHVLVLGFSLIRVNSVRTKLRVLALKYPFPLPHTTDVY